MTSQLKGRRSYQRFKEDNSMLFTREVNKIQKKHEISSDSIDDEDPGKSYISASCNSIQEDDYSYNTSSEYDCSSHNLPQNVQSSTHSFSKTLNSQSLPAYGKTDSNPKRPRSNGFLYAGMLILFFVIGLSFASKSWTGNSQNSSNSDAYKTCSFSDLSAHFPNQEDYLWKSLKVGIENILNEITSMPAVFLFIHNNSSHANSLVMKIAQKSSNCFDPSLHAPLEMVSEDFTSLKTINDYGHAIEKYKQTIKEGNVILIAKLNEIPAEAARALHAICDTYTPIVPRVIIFLTLISEHNQGHPTEVAENTLSDLWGPKLKRSELDPLITRVTDQVFKLF